MKKSIALISIMLLCTAFIADGAKPKKAQKTVVYVTSLDCENCAKKIRENISFEKGVKDLSVSVPERTVEVKFDESKTDTLKLRKALNKLGYEAKVVEFK